MDFIEKFRDGLTPEDFTQLEESIKSMIEEKAKVRAEFLIEEEKLRLEELAEEFCQMEVKARLEAEKKALDESYETKVKEFKETAVEKLQEMADKFVEKSINEEVEKKTVELEKKYEEKVQKLEESVLDQLDKFLDCEITEKISDDLLKEIAINEAHKPLIAGIFSLFETHLVGLDSDGSKKIEEVEAEKKELEKKLNEAYSEKLQMHQKNDQMKTALLISSKTSGLTAKQQKRVVTMFEGKSFEEVSGKIDTFLEVLEEGEMFGEEGSKKSDKKVINEDLEIFQELDDEIEKEVKTVKLDESDKGFAGSDLDWEKISNLL